MHRGALLAGLLLTSSLNAQWQEVQFDDSDMALDLSEAFTFQKYPAYDQYLEMMQQFASSYPSLCRLDTFGTSVEGRLLLALEISDHPGQDEPEAGFFYTSSMHGDEVAGFVLLLRLANHLLEGYGADSEVTRLVDNLSIWINPLANPDGSYSADEGASFTHAVRYNSEGVDLNRDFPAPGRGEADDETGRALENQHMMRYLRARGFTLSANIHSGDEVVNYPWDHTRALNADDAWYRLVSREYADEAMAVDPDYMFGWPDHGITNGAAWYVVPDGRQDYMNYFLEGREVTLELSNEKLLSSGSLEELWNKNSRSLLNYMAQCMYGIRGMVSDRESREPVRALIRIPGHDSTYSVVHSTAGHGDFYRLIKEGTYDLEVSAPGYLTDTLREVEVTDFKATHLQVQLARDPLPGIEPMPASGEFRLYPNPAREQIYLTIHPLNGNQYTGQPIEIRVYSVDGMLQIHRRFNSPEFPLWLNTQSIPAGFYLLKINTPGVSVSIGFVKQE